MVYEEPQFQIRIDLDFEHGTLPVFEHWRVDGPPDSLPGTALPAAGGEPDSADWFSPENSSTRDELDPHLSPLETHRVFDLYDRLPFRPADSDFLHLGAGWDLNSETESKDPTRLANEDIIVTGIRPPSLGGSGGGDDGGSGDTIDHQAGFNTGGESGSDTDNCTCAGMTEAEKREQAMDAEVAEVLEEILRQANQTMGVRFANLDRCTRKHPAHASDLVAG